MGLSGNDPGRYQRLLQQNVCADRQRQIKRQPADIVFYYKKVRVIRYLTIMTPLARRIDPS
jgi:hypothetical protein